MTPEKQHNFRDSLALSQSYSEAPWWVEVYQKAFPNFAAMTEIRDDGWAQRGGIDRSITLTSGKVVLIDEKVRQPGNSGEDYSDILLEYWSDAAKKVPGWVAKDLACDFIAYAFVQSRTCYLIPFLMLRRAWRANGRFWVEQGRTRCAGFRLVDAQNRGYVTRSVAVPIPVLMAALKEAMVVRWSDQPMQPPNTQLVLA